MADQQNLGALLAALAGQTQRTSAQQSHPSTVHAQLQNLAAGLNSANAQSAPAHGVPNAYALPQPTSSGAMDLSNIKPVNSGTVTLADAIARAKSIAAERGVSAYRGDAPAMRYDDARGGRGSAGGGSYRGRSRSRSRSPPPRRDTYRDNYNPYRDERRGRNFEQRERERSFSPPRRGGGGSAAPYSPPTGRNYGVGGAPARGGAPAPAPGGGREKNPDAITEQMHIESGLVGLIIGRGGETLRRVEQETGARVQFLTGSDHRDTTERVCNIIGTRTQIAAARQQIAQIIEDNAKGNSISVGGGGGPKRSAPTAPSHQPPLRDGEDSLQIMVPDRTVGLIIGRGGETIRDLQERSGCHINIVGEQKSVNGLRPVNLIGTAESAKRAKDLIMEIVDSDIRSQAAPGGVPTAPVVAPSMHNPFPKDRPHSGGMAPGGGGQEVIRVPIDAVGMIIGKGGETIKEMQSSTGCRINVSSQFHLSDTEREISLQGPKDAIARARKAIEDKVEASQKKQGGSTGQGNYGSGGDRDQRDRAGHEYGNSGDRYNQHNQQPAHMQQAQGSAVPTAASGADGSADPYAPWGGYQNYVAMYYAMLAQQNSGGAPGTSKPPGAPGT